MAKEVVIRISAQDAASPVFKKLAGEAQQMGAQVEMANERSGQSFQRFNAGAAALGAAIGSATLALGDFTRAAAEDQANQARLQQSVENTGKAYDDYAQRIDAAIKKGQSLAFSDDQTRDALVRLNLVTNDTGASLDELSVVMDFARAKNIDLGTAADIVGKVMGGNLGILARYGIQLDKNATSEEALAAIQQRSAGQAQTYANTEQGMLARRKDQWDELTESIGAHVGALQSVLLLLPGLTAGYTALSGALSGLVGAEGALSVGSAGLTAGLAALILGAGAAGYSANTDRGGWGDKLFANIAIGGAGLANWLTPGNAFSGIQGQFENLKSGDELAKAMGSAWYTPPGVVIGGGTDPDQYRINQLKTAGVLPPDFKGSLGQAADYIATQASQLGISNQQYITLRASSSPNVRINSQTGQIVGVGDWQAMIANRILAQTGGANAIGTPTAYGSLVGANYPAATGAPGAGYDAWLAYNRGLEHNANAAMYGGAAGVGRIGGSGAVANDISAGAAVGRGGIASLTGQEIANMSLDATKQLNDALEKRIGIFAHLVDGQETWNDAQAQFKAVQDGLIVQENVYSQQQSEYQSQVDSITKAHELLNQRVEEGIPLTKAQQEFQDKYNEALERGQGAVDDATISQGMLAEQYLLNMQQGDKLNETMQNQTGAVGDLVSIVRDLILALEGVPPDVQTQIDLYGADKVLSDAYAIQYALEAASGTYHASFIVDTIMGPAPEGPQLHIGGYNGLTAMANGGTAYDPLLPRFANGGQVRALVGEFGPELVTLSRGDQVMPSPGSRSQLSRMSRNAGGVQQNYYGPVTLVPPTSNGYDAYRQAALGEARN